MILFILNIQDIFSGKSKETKQMSGHLGWEAGKGRVTANECRVYFWISENVLETDYAEGGTTLKVY